MCNSRYRWLINGEALAGSECRFAWNGGQASGVPQIDTSASDVLGLGLFQLIASRVLLGRKEWAARQRAMAPLAPPPPPRAPAAWAVGERALGVGGAPT
jgi:hypothetical protein